MPVKTQGTDLYVIDPDDDSLIDVGCVTSIDGIDTTPSSIDISCLQDIARRFVAGMEQPGTMTFGLSTDLRNSNHLRLLELKQAGQTLKWAVGWSESPGTPPTIDTDGSFIADDARSWLFFEGFINAFPFSFALDAVVQSNVGVQVSGEITAVPAGS